MDRVKAKELSEAMMKALGKLEKKYGVTFSRGNGSFTMGDYSMKVTATENDASGKAVSKYASDFKNNAFKYGMKESDLGRTFTSQGSTYVLEGSVSRNRKYPLIAKKENGSLVKMPANMVKMAMWSEL
jgi:hypothetical protein